ncbi:hypothetical protein V8C26DRAFT_11673 [Trichoderma gracile]
MWGLVLMPLLSTRTWSADGTSSMYPSPRYLISSHLALCTGTCCPVVYQTCPSYLIVSDHHNLHLSHQSPSSSKISNLIFLSSVHFLSAKSKCHPTTRFPFPPPLPEISPTETAAQQYACMYVRM